MNDKIAIYLRLSLADGDLKKGSKDESNSIENQRMLLHDYIGKQEDLFGEIVEYQIPLNPDWKDVAQIVEK